MPNRRLVSHTRHLEKEMSPRQFKPHQWRLSLVIVTRLKNNKAVEKFKFVQRTSQENNNPNENNYNLKTYMELSGNVTCEHYMNEKKGKQRL